MELTLGIFTRTAEFDKMSCWHRVSEHANLLIIDLHYGDLDQIQWWLTLHTTLIGNLQNGSWADDDNWLRGNKITKFQDCHDRGRAKTHF